MPGGRPKKLKELKEAHGTLRDDRQIRSIVPAAVSEVPSLPKGVELYDMAMNVWIDVSKKLAPFSALKETDLYTLAAFCDATEDGNVQPMTVTYRKDAESGFYRVFGYNAKSDDEKLESARALMATQAGLASRAEKGSGQHAAE